MARRVLRSFFCLLAPVTAALGVACGGSAGSASQSKQPAAAQKVPIQTTTLFALHATPAKAASGRATVSRLNALPAIGSETIDTAALLQLIKQRLSQVEADALRDLVTGIDTGSEPMEDLLNAIATLIVSTSDGKTKSQALLAALARDGLSFGIAKLAEHGVLDPGACPTPELDTTAYEGLAASTFLRALGFPYATGQLDPQCQAFATNVTNLVDGAAKLPSENALESLTTTAGAASTSCKDDARPAVKALQGMAIPSDASIQSLRTLSSLAYTAATTAGGASTCVKDLNAFVSAYGTTLGALSGILDDATPLSTIRAASRSYRAFVGHGPGASRAESQNAASAAPTDAGAVAVAPPSVVDAGASDSGPHLCGDAGPPPSTSVLLSEIEAIVVELANGTPLNRGDIVTLAGTLRAYVLDYVCSDVPRDILNVFLESIPDSIKTDTSSPVGVSLDVPALVTSMVARFDSDYSTGWYVRATVGAGYLYTSLPNGNNLAPTYYEEIGFGRRCYGAGGLLSWANFTHCNPSSHEAVLHGFQVVSSGLLFQIASNSVTKNEVFVGGGYSLNFYRLLDLSINAGSIFNLNSSTSSFTVLAGLQLPIFDYLSAVSSSPSVDATSTAKQ